MSADPMNSQPTTSQPTILQEGITTPTMNIQISTDFFWALLEGGYVGTTLCQHPTYGQSHLTVQQFIEPDSFGIALYQPSTLDIIHASVVTHEQVLEQLRIVENQGEWSFYPSTLEEPSPLEELNPA